jgi:hypothetical protein
MKGEGGVRLLLLLLGEGGGGGGFFGAAAATAAHQSQKRTGDTCKQSQHAGRLPEAGDRNA